MPTTAAGSRAAAVKIDQGSESSSASVNRARHSPPRSAGGDPTPATTQIRSAARCATTAATPSSPDVPAAIVRFGDLNLGTEAGARTLYHRIASVARQVCPDAEARDLSRKVRAQACQKEAIERAVRAVNSPRLATAHAAATRQG